MTSPRMLHAMKLLREGWPEITPYRAARMAGIDVTTMYKSPLYKQWKAEHAETCKECGQEIRK